MLIIPMRKEEFIKIKNKEQKELKREIKPYWISRINNSNILKTPQKILLRKGYNWDSPSLLCTASATIIDTKDDSFYSIKIHKIIAENVNFYDNSKLLNT